jgi:hypothetical protein
VTPGAFAESGLFGGLTDDDMMDFAMVARVRLSLYQPGGELAREFARNPTVLVVNDTVFAHGGLLPSHGEAHMPEVVLHMCGVGSCSGCTPVVLLGPLARWGSRAISERGASRLVHAAEYGIERLNGEVAAWMRGDLQPDGTKSKPPFLAMGWVEQAARAVKRCCVSLPASAPGVGRRDLPSCPRGSLLDWAVRCASSATQGREQCDVEPLAVKGALRHAL